MFRVSDSIAGKGSRYGKFCLILFSGLLSGLSARAQLGHTVLSDTLIQSVLMEVDGNSNVLPIISRNSGQHLDFSFDYLSHEYQRFTYRIEHCDYRGNVTQGLFPTDYVYAETDEELIEDYEYSTNTTVLYTHYKLSVPNVRMRPLLSGNYRLTVNREDETGEVFPVIQTYFAIVDSKVSVSPRMTTNTDKDWNSRHQQMSLEVACNELQLRDVSKEIQVVVMQNRRADAVRYVSQPTAQDGYRLFWKHDRDLIFPAGNEYRKFEVLSTAYPGLHADYVRWKDPYYHNVLFEDEPRKNYLFDKDYNGGRVIRGEDGIESETEADYVLTEFTLRSPRLHQKDVYVNGEWSSAGMNNYSKMIYNEEKQAYVASVLLKLGYYNYQYLCFDSSLGLQSYGETLPFEGDFFQTENQYDVLVYYSPLGGRYVQLVGAVSFIYKP